MYLLIVSNQLLDLLEGTVLLQHLLLAALHELHGVVQFVLVLFRKTLDNHQLGLVVIAQKFLQSQVMLGKDFMNH